jgi:hypothetical protein
MRRAIRCKIHPDSCDWEQAVGHPESCSKMKHLRPETVPIFWGCEGSGLEPWRARPCKDDTQLTGPATPHRIIAQLVREPSRLTCALGGFSFGGELDLDMSLTPDVESTPSVAKLYEYPGASIYSYLFLRRVQCEQ